MKNITELKNKNINENINIKHVKEHKLTHKLKHISDLLLSITFSEYYNTLEVEGNLEI